MDIELVLLRIVHILLGLYWVGSALFVFSFLEPVLRGLGPTAGPVMQRLAARRMPLFTAAAAVLTILAGARLYWRVSGGFNPAWMHARMGIVLSGGALAGIGAFLVGMLLARPAAQHLAAARSSAGDAARGRVERLQSRLRVFSLLTIALLLVCVVCMAVARYV